MTERIWRCDCGSGHIITIHHFDDDTYLWLESSVEEDSLWDRLKAALRMIWRGRETLVEVVLSADMAREIREALAVVERPAEQRQGESKCQPVELGSFSAWL